MKKKTNMKLSFITATPWIKKYGSQSDFILALAHLLPSLAGSQGSAEYEREIIDTKLPILLDNGLFEKHVPEPTESLIQKAVKIGAYAFFAPDRLYDAEYTKIELLHAINLNKYMKTGIKVAAVVQANNPKDYKEQLLEFNTMEDVSLIGLSILSIPESFEAEIGEHNITESRIYLMKWMIEYGRENNIQWKQMHLLGLGNSYADVIFASENCPWIISQDSSCAFQSGQFGKRLTDNLEVPEGKVKFKVEFGLQHLSEGAEENIQYNIDLIKKVIQGA